MKRKKQDSNTIWKTVQLVETEPVSSEKETKKKTDSPVWENSPGPRFYIAEMSGQLVGIFSNRKKLFEALNFSGLEGCCVHGKRKEKEVTSGSIGGELDTNNKFCKIWRGDKVAFRIWEIGLNHLNPKIIEAKNTGK